MHELSICYEIVETLEDVVKENQIEEVQKIVLEVGELANVIPMYLYECFPCAVEGTKFEKAELVVETIAGIGQCRKCGNKYQLFPVEGFCPSCGQKDFELLSGREFNIKEIVAR